MSEFEKIQKLHQLSVKGEVLTSEEQSGLEDWYERSDHEEDSVLNDHPFLQSPENLRENLAKTTRQAALISREIESLISQNDTLRIENRALRNALEERLLENVA